MNRRMTLAGLFLALFTFADAIAQKSRVHISPNISTQGPGIDFKYALLPGFNIRTGASSLSFDFDTKYTVNELPADAHVNVDLGNAHLLLDVHPFISTASFAQKFLITAGAAYFWKDQGDAMAVYNGNIQIQDLSVPGVALGELYGLVKWKKVTPYMGIGFENPLPKHRLNMGFAIGAYYMGKPEVTVTGTKFLTDTAEEERQFRENVSDYRFLPVLQLTLNIGI
jgi:hypothetical protein